MAECLGEGVDPTKMCQTLVERVARSEQLQAVAEPEVLILFEDWMEELEREALTLLEGRAKAGPDLLASELGISQAGAQFLLAKLKKAGKL